MRSSLSWLQKDQSAAEAAVLAEFVVPRRPVSAQTKSRNRLQDWKAFVRSHAAVAWAGQPVVAAPGVQLTVVHLYDEAPIDVDNIVKPVLDALVGVILEDDTVVTDLDSHQRPRGQAFDLTRLPISVMANLGMGQEFVYLRIAAAKTLEDYLS